MHPVHETTLKRTVKKCTKTFNPRTELLHCSLNPFGCGDSVSAENRGSQTSQISQEGDMAVCGIAFLGHISRLLRCYDAVFT